MRPFVSGKQVECKARQDRGTPGSIRGQFNAAQPMTSEFTLVGVDLGGLKPPANTWHTSIVKNWKHLSSKK